MKIHNAVVASLLALGISGTALAIGSDRIANQKGGSGVGTASPSVTKPQTVNKPTSVKGNKKWPGPEWHNNKSNAKQKGFPGDDWKKSKHKTQ